MSEVALCLRAANRQSVLSRTVVIAFRLGVSIITVRVPPAVDERDLADLTLVVQGGEVAVANLLRRLERVVDVASIELLNH